MTSELRFLGAAGTVTGSRFLVDSGSARVVVDCGMFQGRKDLRLRNWAPFPVEPASVDAVVLTHAHLDHVGALPALVRDGFRGVTWCTPSTAELAAIVLRDSAHLHEEEAAYANRKGFSKHHPALPLYTTADAEAAIETLRPLPFHAPQEVAGDVEVVLRPAGHILGSATAALRVGAGNRRLLFSGDLGRSDHPLLSPPDDPPAADVVVTESTYGGRAHTALEDGLDQLADIVTTAVSRGGKVIIPAFAVDRTEVVLIALVQLVREGRIPRLPIHVDSPMALAVLGIYREAMDGAAMDVRPGVDSSVFEGCGSLHEVRTVEESRALGDLAYPAVIISASGMATGGRVVHHLVRSLPDPRNAVLLAGRSELRWPVAVPRQGERFPIG